VFKRHLAVRLVLGLVAVLVLIQVVPYGRSHANPSVKRAVKWDSPRTAKLFAQACQDCHSNLTDWRWYDSIAPASWLVQHDIEDGRRRLNVSDWQRGQPDVGEVIHAITSGSMPPLQYKLVHAGGRLSQAQRRELARGIRATFRKDPPPIRPDRG
jgi:mono/diheme cytochrome c family protein